MDKQPRLSCALPAQALDIGERAAVLTSILARIGARQPVAGILQAEFT